MYIFFGLLIASSWTIPSHCSYDVGPACTRPPVIAMKQGQGKNLLAFTVSSTFSTYNTLSRFSPRSQPGMRPDINLSTDPRTAIKPYTASSKLQTGHQSEIFRWSFASTGAAVSGQAITKQKTGKADRLNPDRLNKGTILALSIIFLIVIRARLGA